MPETNSTDFFVVAPESVGQIDYGVYTKCNVFESIRNSSLPPEKWQFRYEPLFYPLIKENGDLDIEKTKIGSKYQVSLRIILDDSRAAQLALLVATEANPEVAKKLKITSVAAIPSTSIKITCQDLESDIPTASFHQPDQLASNTQQFRIIVNSPDETTADSVVALLQAGPVIDYTVSFAAKSAVRNTVSVSYDTLKQSNLYVTLNGLPKDTSNSGAVYIHRDDARRLLAGSSTLIKVDGVIEDPEEFDKNLASEVLKDLLASKVNKAEDQFDDNLLKSTYNGDDLKPDVVTQSLQKVFVKDSGSGQWKRSGSSEVSGKLGIVDLLSLEAGGKSSYSDEELVSFLKEHDIEANITGNLITAKSIDLRQVNLNKFDLGGSYINAMTYVTNIRQNLLRSIDLGIFKTSGLAHLDYHSRLTDLENQVMPIGAIMGWGTDAPPAGWMICDGTALPTIPKYQKIYNILGIAHGAGTDVDKNPIAGCDFNLPDYRGLILRGVAGPRTDRDPNTSDTERHANRAGGNTGNRVGSIQSDSTRLPDNSFITDVKGEHDHACLIHNSINHGSGGDFWFLQGNTTEQRTSPNGNHNHTITLGGDAETRGKNAYVHYIIKVQ